MIDREQIATYLSVLFGRLIYKPNHFINVRGIGEKGTDREGLFQEDCWAQPGVAPEGLDGDDMLAHDLAGWAWVWAQHNVATYIVPAVLGEARGKAESVELFPAAVVDLDTGDTLAKATYLGEHLGRPTMVVRSGGITDAGTPKLHLYWVFDEPCDDIERVVNLRHTLAEKVGGDLQFGRGTESNPLGRAHQPIRVPGSVHSKNDSPTLVRLMPSIGDVVDVDIFAESVRRMPRSQWAIVGAPSAAPVTGFDFGADKHLGSQVGRALTTEVHEGGEDRTRWSEFSRVAGGALASVRQGQMSLDEAHGLVRGWVASKMVPPWPDARIDKEFRALVNVDERTRGPLPGQAREEPKGAIVDSPALGLTQWATHRWTDPDRVPERKFLVEGLFMEAKPHLLVAEGGAGKTFAMLDLCLKVSGPDRGDDVRWMGQRVKGEPGTVVMLTTEDDRDELHIRIDGLDREGQRFRSGERMIVVPAVNTGRGPFTFGERDRVTGNVTPSAGLAEFKGWLEAIPDLRLVIIDTLNTTLHGEENSATVINEYSKLLSPICGRMGAALIITHHIRKQDSKFPIKTAEDMMAAVRGSSALPAAFRAVIGMWHCHNFGGLMQAMGVEPRPRHLWRLGVLKANNPEMMPRPGYLLRNEAGGLEDVTARVLSSASKEGAQHRAWLLAGVRVAAEGGAPYRHASKDSPHGLYGRRAELHPSLRGGARTELPELTDKLIERGELVVRQIEWREANGRIKAWPTLDVAGGRYDCETPDRVEQGAPYKPVDWGAWAFDDTTGEVGMKGARMSMAGA